MTMIPQQVNCYGVSFIALNPVIDCHDNQTQTNSLFVQEASKVCQLQTPNLLSSTNFTNRIIRSYEIVNKLTRTLTEYVFRAVPWYGSSEQYMFALEVILISENCEGSLVYLLDMPTIKLISSIKDIELVDFHVDSDGLVYIINRKKNLIVLKFNENCKYEVNTIILVEFDFIQLIDLGDEENLGLSFNAIINQQEGVYQKSLAILQVDRIVLRQLDNVQQTIITTDTTLLPGKPYNIQLSQWFVSVQFDTKYVIYSTGAYIENELAFVQNSHQLFHPFKPILIIIDPKQSTGYIVSNGELILHNSNALQPRTMMTLSAQENIKSCHVVVYFQIIENTNASIFQNNNILNGVNLAIQYANTTVEITNSAIGPDVHYESPDNNTSFKNLWKLNSSVKLTNMELLYSQIVMLKGEGQFYFFCQIDPTYINVWLCDPYNCLLVPNNLTTTQTMTDDIFDVLTNDQGQVIVVLKESESSVLIYNCLSLECHFHKTVILEVDGGIGQVMQVRGKLFVAQQTKLVVFDAANDYQRIDQIDAITITRAGFGVPDFRMPTLFVNRVVSPSFLIITTNTEIYYAQYYNGLELLNVVSQGNAKAQLFFIYAVTFIQFNTEEGNQNIQQYNYEDLSNMYYEYDLQLYGKYTYPDNPKAHFVEGLGYLYVLAESAKGNAILVIKQNTLQNNAIYRVLDDGEFIHDFSVGGNEENMTIYVSTAKFQNFVVLSSKTYLTTPSHQDYRQEEFVHYTNLNFVAKSDMADSSTCVSLRYRTFNTLVRIESQDGVIRIQNKANQVIDNLNQWVSGQVVDYKLICDQCHDDVQLHIAQWQGAIEGLRIDSYARESPNLQDTYILSDGLIYVFDDELQITAQSKKDDDGLTCSLMDYEQLFYVVCSNTTGLFLKTYNDILELQETYPFPPTTNAKKIIKKFGMIFLLDNQGALYIESATKKITQLIVDFAIVDFDVPFNDNSFINLMLMSSKGQIVFHKVGTNARVQIRFNLKSFIQNNPDPVPADNEFLRCQFLTYGYDAELKEVTTQIIFTTSKVFHYVIKFDLNENYVIPQLVTTINRYGSWQALPQLAINGQFIIIPYSDGSKTLFSIYQTSDIFTQSYVNPLEAYQIVNNTDNRIINFFISSSLSAFYVDQAGVSQILIDQTPRLRILNPEKVVKQAIQIQYSNDFSSDTAQLIFQIVDEENNHLWLWITLGVVAGIVLLASGTCYVLKKKKQVEPQLL